MCQQCRILQNRILDLEHEFEKARESIEIVNALTQNMINDEYMAILKQMANDMQIAKKQGAVNG